MKHKLKTNLIKPFTSIFVILVVLSIGAYGIQRSYGDTSTPNITISSASSSYTVGQTVTFNIYENSGGSPVNGVEADITYPSNCLQYSSYSTSGSAFNSPGPESVTVGSTTGEFDSAMLDTSTVTASQSPGALVDSVSFTVINYPPVANCTDTITFLPSTSVGYDGTNLNETTAGASFVLSAAPSGGGSNPSGGGPTSPPPSTPPPSNQNTNKNSAPAKAAPATTVQTNGPASTAVSLPSGSSVQLSEPVTVQTTQGESQGRIVKVEYIVNNKLIKTVSSAPFEFKVDTTDMLNGTYNLTTKTFYSSGKIISTNQKILVKNKFSLNQLNLAAERYGLAIATICVVLALFTYFYIFRGPVGHIMAKRQAAADILDARDLAEVKEEEQVEAKTFTAPKNIVTDDEVKVISPTIEHKDEE